MEYPADRNMHQARLIAQKRGYDRMQFGLASGMLVATNGSSGKWTVYAWADTAAWVSDFERDLTAGAFDPAPG